MLISVVFSFRNEAGNLEELIRRTRAAFDAAAVEHEMIFVNDASTDGSMAILERYAAEDRRIKVVTTARRFGVSPCALAGMRLASGDAVIYMDSDLQDPPELIRDLVSEFRNGADVVNTVRTERLGEPWLKLFVTRIAYKLIRVISAIDIPVNAGDFKLLSRRVVDVLVGLNEYDPFLRGLVRWVGFKQVELYYRREARSAGKSHFFFIGLGQMKAFLSGVTSFSSAPLYFALFIGMLVSISAFLYLVYIVVLRLAFGLGEPGWPAIMVTMLFLSGMILMTIGILGIYIANIHQQVKARPSIVLDGAINIAIPDGKTRSVETETKRGSSGD